MGYFIMTITFSKTNVGNVPAQTVGLVLLLDPTRDDTIDTSPVSTYTDLSRTNNDATQGTGADQPESGSDTINGLNVITFDGSGDGFDLANTISSPYTAFVVEKGQGYLLSGATTRMVPESATGLYMNSPGGITALDATWRTDLTTQITTFKVDAAGAIDVRNNGVSVATGASMTSADISRIGLKWDAGSGLPTWTDVVGEVGILDHIASETETTNIERYLGNKWGVSV
jgi:hypothetical protein